MGPLYYVAFLVGNCINSMHIHHFLKRFFLIEKGAVMTQRLLAFWEKINGSNRNQLPGNQ